MKLVEIAQYVVYLIPVLIVGVAVLSFFSGRDSLQARVMRGLHGLKEKIKTLVVWTVVYALLFFGVCLLQNWTEASTVIGFNYKEASQGLNPNSTRFNTYDIISDDVLVEALKRLGSDLSVRELRSTLSVAPLAAGEEISIEQQYVSTEYVLSYSARLKTLLLNPRKTVDTVAEVYNEMFHESYDRKTHVLDVDFTPVDEADYLDKIKVLDEMASTVRDYMLGCQMDNQTFRASFGESFADVATHASKFKSVTLERLKSYILTNGVSNDREQYISRLNYDNRVKTVSYQKNVSAYEVRLNAIDYYEREMATIVLVPTRDEDGEFYMGRTKIGVDNFAVEAESYLQSATRLQEAIETNNYEISSLRSGNSSNRAAVDSLLESAKAELQDIEVKAKTIVEEYDAENNKSSLVITPQGRSIKETFQLKKGIALTVGFLAVLVLLFVVHPGNRGLSLKKRVQSWNELLFKKAVKQ